MKEEVILVSACLLGVNSRYDGGNVYCPEVIDELWNHPFIPVCPEQLGGLPTPRSRARCEGGDGQDVLRGTARVINADGEDVTGPYIRGAQETLRIAELVRARKAILKENSPSCGCKAVHRKEGLVGGMGVTAALLAQNGVEVVSEEGAVAAPNQSETESQGL